MCRSSPVLPAVASEDFAVDVGCVLTDFVVADEVVVGEL
jgi:hypothetical protein